MPQPYLRAILAIYRSDEMATQVSSSVDVNHGSVVVPIDVFKEIISSFITFPTCRKSS